MKEQRDKFLYKAFHEYLDECVRIAKIKWDSVALEDLIHSGRPGWEFFVRQFQESEKFNLLCEELEKRDPSKPNPDDETYYQEYYDYSLRLRSCIESFFNNTGAYDAVMACRKIDTAKLFSHFIDALEEKEVEILRYAEICPLIIEFKKGESLEVNGFRFSNKVSGYDKMDQTNFIFVCRKDHSKQSLGCIQNSSTEAPFQDILLILNLYFEKPVFISRLCRHVSSLLSQEYGWDSKFLRFDDDFWHALTLEYEHEAINEADEDGHTNWDLHNDFIASKEAEFIKSGKAPVIIVTSNEIEKLKQFIIKTSSFLKSDVYNESKYFQVALNHYAMAHKDDSNTGAVEGIIALEALFVGREPGELKKTLAIRLAGLLGESSEEKSRIKKTMEELYNNRCRYVHGRDMSKGKFDPRLRNLLRLSLLTFFGLAPRYNSNKKREELLNNLDNVFDESLAKFIRIQAAEFLSLARPWQLYEGSRK